MRASRLLAKEYFPIKKIAYEGASWVWCHGRDDRPHLIQRGGWLHHAVLTQQPERAWGWACIVGARQ
jgi:hypothetical protein